MKFFRDGLFCAACLLALAFSAQALEPSKQQVIDAYRSKFDMYVNALQDLGTALSGAKSDADVVKATDRFCDTANRFVDEFNATQDRYRGTEELKSLDNDPEAKKAVDELMSGLRKRIDEAKPTFDNLFQQFSKYGKSPEVRRVRDRASATFQRIQLITL